MKAFMYCFFASLGCILALMIIPGCRGQKSVQPPIHLIPDMDNQGKYKAYGGNPFFSDGRNMRPLPEGTVPRGHLNADEVYYTGMADSQFVSNPERITMALMERGRERYDIFCSVCHGLTGDGEGIVIKKGFTPSPSYAEDRILQMQDGEIFQVITNGVRTMASMRIQVPVDDRWAIVAYVRALQRSMNASLDDVPEDKRSRLN